MNKQQRKIIQLLIEFAILVIGGFWLLDTFPESIKVYVAVTWCFGIATGLIVMKIFKEVDILKGRQKHE